VVQISRSIRAMLPNLTKLTAKNSTTGGQETKYVYGTDKGRISPLVYRNDILRAVIYPDSNDVADPLGDGAGLSSPQPILARLHRVAYDAG
jgi:hypothetical protein